VKSLQRTALSLAIPTLLALADEVIE